MYFILEESFYNKGESFIFKEINAVEVSSGVLNLELKTYKNNYGITLVVEDCLINFEKKFNKIIKAFATLIANEPIKTTYGVLKINNNLNCLFLE